MDTLKILSIIIGILFIYAIPCFFAHFIDFGWNFVSGEWLNKDFKLIKWMRSGLFHKILIFFVLTILLYGGIKEVLQIIPETWTYIDKSGQAHPYRSPIASVFASIVAAIIMHGFSVCERLLEKETFK